MMRANSGNVAETPAGAAALNGSNESVTPSTVGNGKSNEAGWRASQQQAPPQRSCGGTTFRPYRSNAPVNPALGAIEPLAHFLAGLEKRHAFLIDSDVGAGARIAPGARRALLDRKCAETAQFDPVAARHRRDDLPQYGIDDILDVALVEVGILRRDMLNEFRLIMVRRPYANVWIARERRSVPCRKGAKGPIDRQG